MDLQTGSWCGIPGLVRPCFDSSLSGKELRQEQKRKKLLKYYSAIKKNSFQSILMRWMKLEPIIQSEVSQKDKDHYNILTHIYGI